MYCMYTLYVLYVIIRATPTVMPLVVIREGGQKLLYCRLLYKSSFVSQF